MKRKTIVCVLCSLLAICGVLTGCIAAPMDTIPPTSSASFESAPGQVASSTALTVEVYGVQMFDPDTLDELEQQSEFIVRGTLRDDATPNLQWFQGHVGYGMTVSTLDILEVYKGDLEGVGNIPLGEEYYVDPEFGPVHFGNYYPSEVGREYIFFLEYQDEIINGKQSPIGGIYVPWGYEDGRFPVPSATARGAVMDAEALPNEELNLGPDSSEQYRSLYQEVIDKYMGD